MKKIYITFHINNLNGYTPIAVSCDNLDDARAVGYDAISLEAYSHIRINRSGRFRKDAIVVSVPDYWNYHNHNKWEKLYKNRFFNTNYLID